MKLNRRVEKLEAALGTAEAERVTNRSPEQEALRARKFEELFAEIARLRKEIDREETK